MNIASKKRTDELLRLHNLCAKKRFGQNFLVDSSIANNIVNLSSDNNILEIGPGLGALTELLLKMKKNVITCEIDKDMVKVLSENFGNLNNFSVINDDIMKLDLSTIFINESYEVISNLPYYLTSKIITKLIISKAPIKKVVAMMQKEVALKLLNYQERTFLPFLINNFTNPQLRLHVSKNAFLPRPNVDSAVLVLDIPDCIDFKKEEFEIIKNCFVNRRKSLQKTLTNYYSETEVAKVLNKHQLLSNIKIDFIDDKLLLELIKNLRIALPF